MVSFTLQTSFLLLLLLFATTFNGSIRCSKNIRCNDKDRELLIMFKEGVVDPFNFLFSWTSDEEDCCAWLGVQCDNITGRVTQLHISSGYTIRGQINLSLLQLEFLNFLDLSINNFEAVSIPSSQLSQSHASPPHPPANFSNHLRHLDFSLNHHLQINDLHWLSQLSSLEYLDLSGNDIGNETKWLQYMAMLPSLSELYLSDCGLRNFYPSLDFVNFTSLVALDLSWNHVESEFPKWLSNINSDISYLVLSFNKFKGQIPISLLRFQNLQVLSLGSNQLNGSIPDWLCQLNHLKEVDVSNNEFYGPIPTSLGNLSSLVQLYLSHNQLSGNLPKSLGQLYNLQYLGVEQNSLGGVISETNFANLSNLESLSLGSNGFEFDFNPNWVPLFQLQAFESSNSGLGPNFPTWLYTQRSLEDLDISSSRISFIDDTMFWSFIARIRTVYLSNNSINGELSNVTINSTYTRLDHNNFTGGLPILSANVVEFRASHNLLSGPLSPLLCHRGSSADNMLATLELSNNHLSGSLPNCWANWTQLYYLDLGNNELTGEVPSSMAALSNLHILDLHNNFFGRFSMDLSNLTNLQYLLLQGNKFSGSLPSTMQKELVVIELRSNQFSGNIPPQICNLTSLMILDLAENMISGSIPHCLLKIMISINQELPAEIIELFTKGQKLEFRNIGYMRAIDLSTNNLSGQIPRELFSLTQTYFLNLSRNHLVGKIPKEIGGMKNLESLDLSYNKLSGEIPGTITNLSFLGYLNLSYNNFTGQIPLGTQIQSFEEWSFVGNLELCGDPLPKKCKRPDETKNPKNNNEENEDDDDYDGFLKSLYLGLGVGFAVGFWGVSGSLFFIRAWRHTFFRFVYRLGDWLYVVVALKFRSFR